MGIVGSFVGGSVISAINRSSHSPTSPTLPDLPDSRRSAQMAQMMPVRIEPLRRNVRGRVLIFIMCFLLVCTDIYWITLSKHVHIVSLWVFYTIWRSIQIPWCWQKRQLWMRKLQQWFYFKLVSVSICKNYQLPLCLAFHATVAVVNEIMCL